MDLSLLFCGFVFGVIGVWMFRQGKKNANVTAIVIAIALMVYPYFVSNIWLAWLIGLALCFIAYLKR